MTLRVYIAASAREVERVRAAQAVVEARGWTLTLDWLSPLLERLGRGAMDRDLSDEEAAVYASGDLQAISTADVVWYLTPREPTRGAYVELGYAIGCEVFVLASGAAERSTLFEALVARVPSDDEAPDFIARVVGEGWVG